MKGFMKIVLAGLVILVIFAGGCAVVIGMGASSVSNSISNAQHTDSAQSKAFAAKFKRVKVGDALSGKGGMTFRQVRALLGKPKPGNVTTTQSQGFTDTSWDYDFVLSNGKSIYSVDFTNGHVSNKTSL
jgi:hypothetical protein